MWSRVLLFTLLLPLGLVASARDVAGSGGAVPRRVVVPRDPAGGSTRYAVMHRFGNLKRIARQARPDLLEGPGGVVAVRNRAGRATHVRIRRFGNRRRIARTVDAAAGRLAGKVLLVRDRLGRPGFVAMKRAGNRRRLEKLAGGSED